PVLVAVGLAQDLVRDVLLHVGARLRAAELAGRRARAGAAALGPRRLTVARALVAAVVLVAACGAQPGRPAHAAVQPPDLPLVYDFATASPQPDFATTESPDLSSPSTGADLAGADFAGATMHPAQGAIPFTQAYANGNAVGGSVGASTPVTVVTQTTPR